MVIHIQSTSKECVIVIVSNPQRACARGTVVVLSVCVCVCVCVCLSVCYQVSCYMYVPRLCVSSELSKGSLWHFQDFYHVALAKTLCSPVVASFAYSSHLPLPLASSQLTEETAMGSFHNKKCIGQATAPVEQLTYHYSSQTSY